MSDSSDFGTAFELTENAVSPSAAQQPGVSSSSGTTQLRVKKPPYPLIIPTTQPTMSGSRIKLNTPTRTTKTAQKLVLLPEEAEVPPSELSDYAETPVTPLVSHIPVNNVYDSTDAERMPKESREINKYSRATAYCTAEGYYLKKLLKFLRDEHNVQPMLYDECVYAPYHFPLLKGRNTNISSSIAIRSPNGHSFMERQIENYENNEVNSYFVMSENEDGYDNVEPLSKPTQNTLTNIGEVFYFDYGVVVFWNMTEDQEQMILDDLARSNVTVRLLKTEDVECETFHFQYDLNSTRQPRIFNDMITLKSDNHMIKLTISHAMSQSTKLALYEWQMESTIGRTMHIPKMLAQTGRLDLNRIQVTKLSGEMFKLRMNVNLVSNVLDTPEIFWAEPSLDPLYSAIRAYLEISQRVTLLNDRCKVISDLLDMLREDVGDEKRSRYVGGFNDVSLPKMNIPSSGLVWLLSDTSLKAEK
ncbi:16641_t:CDS:2 [Cetraspora pellucida]|uniref:16641_t:CDS:1 n=1 Tax=Cetraspora pellucida TaxID=1433469 RepID=A0ACA9JYP8_9GLOM|nr:16641_t:CDS:2 [Cetraspora pellucida]